ncbi:MAG: hypothetical protein FJ298_10200 [Planctomycetes bacterium]|nr:hypothetical protein [Planctomycetota bacterium]
MNRTTALFVALAILLGHALAIHKNALNEIAPPYDMAYVAFRVARNFVQSGEFAWQSGTFGLDSYPSLLWVGVAAIGERLYMPVNELCQAVGFAAALACVLVLARFSPERLAGVIAPVLFVVSGGVASAALSGLETSLLALWILVALLAYERRSPRTMAIALMLAVLTRPQGFVFTLLLLSVELGRRALARGKDTRPTMWLALAAPLALGLGIALLRYSATGRYLSAWDEMVLALRPRALREGLNYLLDFTLASGNAFLFAFPLWYLLRGALSGLGVRACVLTLGWAAMVALGGGGSLPFFEAMTPILAVLLVAVQEAMQTALDSRRRGWPRATWVLFVLGLGGAALASKFPSDEDHFGVERVHRRWMEPRTQARFGYLELNGRMGLAEELQTTERLREIGVFLREHTARDATVLSPWPGAIGYLSRRDVVDPLGRTSPPPGETLTHAWEGRPRADVALALAQRPDYIVPTIRFGTTPPSAQEIAAAWVTSLDEAAHRPQRAIGLRTQMADYELVTVPVLDRHARESVFPRGRFYLMRRSDLGLAPRLELELANHRLRVLARHGPQPQLVDLRVQLLRADRSALTLRPDGSADPQGEAVARAQLLLSGGGERPLTLFDVELDPQLGATEVRAVLRNPEASGDSIFAFASAEAVLALDGR